MTAAEYIAQRSQRIAMGKARRVALPGKGITLPERRPISQLPRKRRPLSCQQGTGPGSVVKQVLAAFGIRASKNCGCEAMCRKMNKWGWTGCLKNRAEIAAWFSAKAKEASIEVSPRGLLRVLIQSWRDKKRLSDSDGG